MFCRAVTHYPDVIGAVGKNFVYNPNRQSCRRHNLASDYLEIIELARSDRWQRSCSYHHDCTTQSRGGVGASDALEANFEGPLTGRLRIGYLIFNALLASDQSQPPHMPQKRRTRVV